MSSGERRQALERALRGDFAEWEGLPDGTEAADFAAISNEASEPGQARLGTLPATFRNYDGGALRVWFDQQDRPFLVQAIQPPLARSSRDVLASLGPPEARLERSQSRIPGAVQWVWASRGVSAHVRGEDKIEALALFPPTNVEYYETWLGGHERPTYRPR